MGKYMRKTKITGEVAVMEVSHQSSLGVRTRAKTLALQLPSPPAPAEPDSGSYLQLRSRRLEKPSLAPAPAPAKPKESCRENPKRNTTPRPAPDAKSPKLRLAACSANSVSAGSVSVESYTKKGGREREEAVPEPSPPDAEVFEVSFGENVLEVESRDRNVRETTPCSLIRDSETIGTPGSTTRPTKSTASNRRMQNTMRRNIPTTHEMEEFFAGSEQLQQRILIEKYNFDPVKDCPLSGRYDWVRLDS